MTEAILLYGDPERHPTIIWRTGFVAPDPVVFLDVDGKGTLLVNGMELGRATAQARVDGVRSYEEFDFTRFNREGGEVHAYAAMIVALLQQADVRRVRVAPDFPVALARALEGADVEVLSDAPVYETDRRHKRREEIEAVRQSQQAAQAGLTRARELLREAEVTDGKLFHDGAPLTSSVLISAIEVELVGRGWAADGTIAAGGAAAADPHMSDSGHLAMGEPVIVDVFPMSKQSRYFGDITRTFVPGEPSAEWLKMRDAVAAAHAAALSTVRAGVNGRDVHRAVSQTLFDAGFGSLVEGFRREGVPLMIHGTGHGVGLEIHEPPRISEADIELVEGDVVTIEPGLYSPEHGSVRLEDTITVTADGYENLTDYPMDWRP